jgi:peptidyl-prolyl cis-trans isomerase C
VFRLSASIAAIVCALVAAPGAFGADLPPNVLARNRWMELTKADYDAALARVPAKLRYEFATSPKRLEGLLNGLLLDKTLAAQARAHGTKPGTEFAKDGKAADPERALAAAELRRVEADAGAAFDARRGEFEQKAREVYALDQEKFRLPEEVRFSDIAVSIKERGDAAALARATEARGKIASGADFAAVAREYSDDQTTREKGGALPFVTAKRLAPDYAKAVFALSKVGEISAPIKAPSAYHVVRLDERKPSRVQTFDEVRDTIMRTLRERYVREQREERIRSVHQDPGLQVNQPAIDALVNPVDPDVFKVAPTGRKAAPAATAPGAKSAAPAGK